MMKIIVPIKPRSVAELEILLRKIDKRVDIIEVCFDIIVQELMIAPGLINHVKSLMTRTKVEQEVQILGVCKTAAEKGAFPGNANQRVELLTEFLNLGGNFVDLDIKHNPAELIHKIDPDKLWLSFHDYQTVPSDLQEIKEAMEAFKPKLYKFAVTPQNQEQLDRFLSFAKTFTEPAIFTTMGPLGLKGRAQLKENTWGAFYALAPEYATATGQPLLGDL
jgi:3-dehydroquinate dehydratase type I